MVYERGWWSQVAQQEAERAKYIVERAKQEALSIKIKATGEAQAASQAKTPLSECCVSSWCSVLTGREC